MLSKDFHLKMKLRHLSCNALLSAQIAMILAALRLTLYAPPALAQTESAEAVGRVAEAITVSIKALRKAQACGSSEKATATRC